MTERAIHRRDFLKTASVAGLGAWLGFSLAPELSPNEKLNLGIIGTANRAGANIAGLKHHNIVALCDIDERFLAAAAAQFPSACTYTDFRKLLEQKNIDAVVVSTPDHTHAPATCMALKAGKHVYCEKPLTHSVSEARIVAQTAAITRLATQMGTQIHAERNYRRVVELIQSNAIGPVRQAHVFCGKSWSGGERPLDTPAPPKSLHFDLWLGPAPRRPYHPAYLPVNWRRWWDFGGGTLGDMGCHYLDLVHWALDLRAPATIAAEGPLLHPETTPPWLIVHYEYPARHHRPPVRVTWYDGGKRPPLITTGQVPHFKNGVLFVGDDGMLFADYRQRLLLPEDQFEDFKPPAPSIPDSPGHYQEWIQACKTGRPAPCNFDYTGALTEAVLLGNVAYRTGKKLCWDAPNLRVTNCPEAADLILPHYRNGWLL